MMLSIATMVCGFLAGRWLAQHKPAEGWVDSGAQWLSEKWLIMRMGATNILYAREKAEMQEIVGQHFELITVARSSKGDLQYVMKHRDKGRVVALKIHKGQLADSYPCIENLAELTPRAWAYQMHKRIQYE